MPLPSRAISHARGHLRVSRLLDGLQKKERLLVVYCAMFVNDYFFHFSGPVLVGSDVGSVRLKSDTTHYILVLTLS